MRNYSSILTLSVSLALIAGCGTENQSPQTAATDGAVTSPLLSLDSLIHKLGTVPEGGIEQTYRFENQHQGTIRLFPAVTSCACNKVKYSVTQVKPGETVEVTASFNGKAREGLTRTQFQIPWTTQQTSGTVTCVIEAKVEAALKLKPSRAQIESRDGAKATVTIERQFGESRPTSVWSGRNEIDCSLSQIDDSHWKVNLQWNSKAPDETRLPPLACDGAMIVVYTEGIGHRQYKIPVQIRHNKEIAVTFNPSGKN